MVFKISKKTLKISPIMLILALFAFPVSAEEAMPEFSEICLPETIQQGYFLDAIKDEDIKNIEFKKNPAGKDSVKFNIDENAHLKGLVKLDVKKDKNSIFYEDSIRSMDVNILKDTGFLNYSAGAYNLGESKMWQDLNNSPVTGGWAAVNPFHTASGIGNLQVGGGYFTGKQMVENKLNREDTYSLFTGYKFSRFSVKGEFLREESEFYNNPSDSWRISNKFTITDSLKLKTGFKQYENKDSTVSEVGFEYSFKETPLINNEHLQLEFDASIREGEEWGSNNSHRFGIKTKYSF